MLRRIAKRYQSSIVLLVIAATAGIAQSRMQVEPGLTIPDAKTPWALETYEGKRQLVPIHHSDADVNHHLGRNLVSGMTEPLFFKQKLTIELKGLNSRNQLHSNRPVIYFLVDEDLDESGNGTSGDYMSFVIVQAKQGKDDRIVDSMKLNAIGTKAVGREGVIDSDSVQLPNHWYRIEPKQMMPEGEYALLAVFKKSRMPSTTVWDFGINLKAPNEKDAIIAKPPEPAASQPK